MKKLITTSVLVLLAVFTLSASSYKLDDQSVDALFNNATETTVTSIDMFNSNAMDLNGMTTVSSSSSTVTVLIALLIDYPVGLGIFGVHRYILGTKGSMWAIYTFTVCGIFGIVPTVDWWVLLIDGLILGNGDKYLDNEKFFMWL